MSVVLLLAIRTSSLYLAFDLVGFFHHRAFMNNIINIINNRSWWIVRRMSFSKRIT
jgi:hypothetical protein